MAGASPKRGTPKPQTIKVYRDSRNGQFVSAKTVKQRPATTETETRQKKRSK